jgi:hypothetical protein
MAKKKAKHSDLVTQREEHSNRERRAHVKSWGEEGPGPGNRQ